VLTPQDKNIITDFAEYLKDNPTLKVALHGHTDNIGEDAANLKLSEDRAKAVLEFLVQKGINRTRLSYKGFGAGKPVASNGNSEGRAQNRRTEFVIISK
jgi:outer membrane protein OmpA-like peptidoglycan-associated protein